MSTLTQTSLLAPPNALLNHPDAEALFQDGKLFQICAQFCTNCHKRIPSRKDGALVLNCPSCGVDIRKFHVRMELYWTPNGIKPEGEELLRNGKGNVAPVHAASTQTSESLSEPSPVEPVAPPVTVAPLKNDLSNGVTAPTNSFKEIALRSAARGESRVLPILVGGKNPLIAWGDTPIDIASTEQWAALYPAWIEEIAAKFPFVNAAVIAKPNENLFIDEDDSQRFRKGYEKFSGEPFPKTYTTSARSNRCQSHWRQTERTRKMGNIAQGSTIDGILSVRQNNLYVLAEGSQHKNGVDVYKTIDPSPAIPMPDKMVDYILSIRTDRNKETGDFTKKAEGWLDAPFIHRNIDNQLIQFAGHYISAKNINDPEELYTLLAAKIEKNGCFYEDSKTPFPCDMERVREIAERKVKEWRTGEEKKIERTPLLGGTPAGTEKVLVCSAEPAAWGTPAPIGDDLSPVLPFKPEFLPASIQPWVKDVSERMSVLLDFAGICALVTLAGVTGRRAFVYPKAKDKEWKESICLSGAVVAPSGKTKTPTWKTFTNVVVENELDWRREHKKKMAQYLTDVEKWKKVQKENSKAEKNGGSVVEVPQPVEPPPCRCNMLNDATPEAMHAIMEDNPEGVLFYRDELSSWVDELDKKEREVQRGLFLAAMNGNDAYGVDRVGRGKVFALMCASVFGGFQPELFQDFLSNSVNVENGMIPRFLLIVWPDSANCPAVDRTADDVAKMKFRSIVRTLAEMKSESIALHFGSEAQPVFSDWLKNIDLKINHEGHLGKRSHLAKYKGGLPKIAALFQIVDVVASGGVMSGTHHIDLEHLNKAINFLVYLESHMHRVYDSIRPPLKQVESLLARRIKSGDLKSGFTARSVQRRCWSGLDKADQIALGLEMLEEKGWVRQYEVSSGLQGGRPTIKWSINPALEGAKP